MRKQAVKSSQQINQLSVVSACQHTKKHYKCTVYAFWADNCEESLKKSLFAKDVNADLIMLEALSKSADLALHKLHFSRLVLSLCIYLRVCVVKNSEDYGRGPFMTGPIRLLQQQ